jgi:hypothetical protein
MWRTEQNVRITYSSRPPRDGAIPAARNTDHVEWEAASGKGGVKTVSGGNTAAVSKDAGEPDSATPAQPLDTGSWDWRGKGFLFWVTSHWEVLGWGERPLADGGVERWVVTWFTRSMFTEEGVDIYCDRKEGVSQETADAILKALGGVPAKELADLCNAKMQPVQIQLPWKER